MAKTRLTKADRDLISGAIINHRFTPLNEAHAAEGHALALQVRAKAYGDFLATMEAAKEGAFPVTNKIKVNVSGRKIALVTSGQVRVFHKHYSGWDDHLLSLTESDKLAAKALAWAERGEELKREKRHLTTVTDATLAAFSTFDDLLTGWPEAESFILARWRSRPDYRANVPAVAIRDLSAALDLPPEVAAAA